MPVDLPRLHGDLGLAENNLDCIERCLSSGFLFVAGMCERIKDSTTIFCPVAGFCGSIRLIASCVRRKLVVGRQKLLQFLAILRHTRCDGKPTDQFAGITAMGSNLGCMLKNFHRVGGAPLFD